MKIITSIVAFLFAATPVLGQGCTAAQRIKTVRYISNSFNEPNFQKGIAKIYAYPLQSDCPIHVSVNGSPGFETAIDAETSKDFVVAAYTVFNHFDTKITDYGNGTTLFDGILTFGVLHQALLPVHARVQAPITFNLTNCLITGLPAFVTVPTDVAGNPVSPPQLPFSKIPGFAQLPGARELLKLLIPAIGNPYNI